MEARTVPFGSTHFCLFLPTTKAALIKPFPPDYLYKPCFTAKKHQAQTGARHRQLPPAWNQVPRFGKPTGAGLVTPAQRMPAPHTLAECWRSKNLSQERSEISEKPGNAVSHHHALVTSDEEMQKLELWPQAASILQKPRFQVSHSPSARDKKACPPGSLGFPCVQRSPRALREMLIPVLPVEAAGIWCKAPEMSHNYNQMTMLQLRLSLEKHACSVARWCPVLCDPMDCSPPGSSVHGILQARIPEQLAISSSRGSSQLRGQARIACIGRWIICPKLRETLWDKYRL